VFSFRTSITLSRMFCLPPIWNVIPGELNHFYAMVAIAFVGGSLVQGLAGHNVAEAAAAGCVVLTGTLQIFPKNASASSYHILIEYLYHPSITV
jgi:type IV secretory pathway VirB2 component (pilin)